MLEKDMGLSPEFQKKLDHLICISNKANNEFNEKHPNGQEIRQDDGTSKMDVAPAVREFLQSLSKDELLEIRNLMHRGRDGFPSDTNTEDNTEEELVNYLAGKDIFLGRYLQEALPDCK